MDLEINEEAWNIDGLEGNEGSDGCKVNIRKLKQQIKSIQRYGENLFSNNLD